jgi:ribonucleoside-diphosphate reductase alpha chain
MNYYDHNTKQTTETRMSFDWLNKDSRTFLSRGYLKSGQSAEDRIREIADAAEKVLDYPGFADKFYNYMGEGYYSLSSPVWANFGIKRGLPISCNGVYVGDSVPSILGKVAEVGMQTKHGAGTSGYFGDIRPRGKRISSGGTADGPVHFMNIFETATSIVSQGNVRKGSFAAYVDIEHPDVEEFLEIREVGHSIQDMSIGLCIGDEWMEEMIAQGEAVKAKELAPNDADKLQLWARIMRKRKESGYPYFFFRDNVNNLKPKVLKDNNIPIHASNLCSEICLPSSDDESFVCNLASMNLHTYDRWKDTDAVKIMTYFLDAVMTEYIEKTEGVPYMEASNRFAKRWRALGIGQLGWHTYLQYKMIPFESFQAISLATEISEHIDRESLKASKEMADRFGEPDGMIGYGERNLTRCAIAPTTSSSFILGQVSPSIEPLRSNYFVKDLAKGQFTFKNPYLARVLESYGKNDEETWMDILTHDGSVQHLDFLGDTEKEVFKTFDEITPMTIVQQAAARQTYIDQGQSLNMMIPPDAPAKDVNQLVIEGWRLGIKTFYYQRSANPAQELVRDIMNCASCEA